MGGSSAQKVDSRALFDFGSDSSAVWPLVNHSPDPGFLSYESNLRNPCSVEGCRRESMCECLCGRCFIRGHSGLL